MPAPVRESASAAHRGGAWMSRAAFCAYCYDGPYDGGADDDGEENSYGGGGDGAPCVLGVFLCVLGEFPKFSVCTAFPYPTMLSPLPAMQLDAQELRLARWRSEVRRVPAYGPTGKHP